MKIVYPEETLTLLAKYDAYIDTIADIYKRSCPKSENWVRELQKDPLYEECIRQKTRIISLSTYQLQLDANEVQALHLVERPFREKEESKEEER